MPGCGVAAREPCPDNRTGIHWSRRLQAWSDYRRAFGSPEFLFREGFLAEVCEVSAHLRVSVPDSSRQRWTRASPPSARSWPQIGARPSQSFDASAATATAEGPSTVQPVPDVSRTAEEPSGLGLLRVSTLRSRPQRLGRLGFRA